MEFLIGAIFIDAVFTLLVQSTRSPQFVNMDFSGAACCRLKEFLDAILGTKADMTLHDMKGKPCNYKQNNYWQVLTATCF